MQNKDIVVVGASAGGVEALMTLVSGLPTDLKASVFIVMHTSPDGPALLDQILGSRSSLPVVKAVDGLPIQHGIIVVAVPDHHLVLERDHVRVTRGPRENMFRPAVDPLFRSAAEEYGPRVISVVLTGGLDDGASGTWTVKKLGGTCIVQDPAEAFAPSMPRSALRAVDVDYCVPLAEIAPLVIRLTKTPAEIMKQAERPIQVEMEVSIAKEERPMDLGFIDHGVPSNYACPECHGVLLELTEGKRKRYRCHTGHAYSTASLLAEFGVRVDDAIWTAIRAVEESVLYIRHVSDQLAEAGEIEASRHLLQRAGEAQRQSDLLREAAAIDGRVINTVLETGATSE